MRAGLSEYNYVSLKRQTKRQHDVRFTPESGHLQCTRRCPLWARSGQRVGSHFVVTVLSQDVFDQDLGGQIQLNVWRQRRGRYLEKASNPRPRLCGHLVDLGLPMAGRCQNSRCRRT